MTHIVLALETRLGVELSTDLEDARTIADLVACQGADKRSGYSYSGISAGPRWQRKRRQHFDIKGPAQASLKAATIVTILTVSDGEARPYPAAAAAGGSV